MGPSPGALSRLLALDQDAEAGVPADLDPL